MEYTATTKETEMDFMYWQRTVSMIQFKMKKKNKNGKVQSIMDPSIFASL